MFVLIEDKKGIFGSAELDGLWRVWTVVHLQFQQNFVWVYLQDKWKHLTGYKGYDRRLVAFPLMKALSIKRQRYRIVSNIE